MQCQLCLSTDAEFLPLPSANLKSSGQHAFFSQVPLLWNNLPYSLQHSSFIVSFTSALKTYISLSEHWTDHWTDHYMAYLRACVCGCDCVYCCVCVCVCVPVYMYVYVCACICWKWWESDKWSVVVYEISRISLFSWFYIFLLIILFL